MNASSQNIAPAPHIVTPKRHGRTVGLAAAAALGFAVLGGVTGYGIGGASTERQVTCTSMVDAGDKAWATLAGNRPTDAAWSLTDDEYLALRTAQHEHAVELGCGGTSPEVAATLRGQAATR